MIGARTIRTQTDILGEIKQRNITNPYSFAHTIEDITLSQDAYFVRAYNQHKTGRWMISIDDVSSFSSVDDFVRKTALPVIDDFGSVMKPNKMVLVKVPKGSVVRKSVARPQDWAGQGHLPGGATQYEILNFDWQKMENWFKDIGDIIEFFK